MARVKGILFSPADEWRRIEAEPATIREVMTGYVAILAGLSAAAALIGILLFGHNVFGVSYRPPLVSTVIGAVAGYGLALLGVFLLATVIDALAPGFGGQKDRVQAFKLAAYAGTAGWVAGLLALYPPLSPLVILGALYGIYLLYLGLPVLMKAPEDRALAYTAVSVVVAIVINMVVAVTVAGIAMQSGGGWMGQAGGATMSGTMRLPGGGSVDMAKLQAASKALEASANQLKAAEAGKPAPAGAVQAVSAEALEALVPVSLGDGLQRSDLNATRQSMGGMATATVEANYVKGDSKLRLSITDLAAAGPLASLGGALNLATTRESATGYEKMGKVDGRLTTEKFDRDSRQGKYTVIVADRFIVEADGAGLDMDQLKAAVNAVGFDRLEGLARAG
jgi:hypothetical protein